MRRKLLRYWRRHLPHHGYCYRNSLAMVNCKGKRDVIRHPTDWSKVPRGTIRISRGE